MRLDTLFAIGWGEHTAYVPTTPKTKKPRSPDQGSRFFLLVARS